MFSNAFLSPRQASAVVLIPAAGSAWKSWRDVRRTIERWQSKSFIQAALKFFRLSKACWLEELLMEEEPELALSFDRPKLFDRMERLGQPAIARKLTELHRNTTTAKWLRVLLRRAPSIRDRPSDPVWRLLNPAPIGHAEWADLALPFTKRTAILGARPLKVWTVGVSGGSLSPVREYPVVREDLHSLQGLTRVLLAMRHYEREGDLAGYYLHLLEAMERCRDPMPRPCLAVLQPDSDRFLADCFGRVHVGFRYPGFSYDPQLLVRVRAALEEAKRN